MSKNLVIHQIPVQELNPALYNPRTWDEQAIVQLQESIKRFGFVDPLIVNSAPERKNVVIGGHMRLAAAKQLGYTEVPAVYIELSDIGKEKELNLRLNRNTGEWDLELLKNFDINLLLEIGFDDTDLSAIWNDALSAEDDCFNVEKAISGVSTPKTQLGDLVQLGDHFLLCGDATKIKDVKRLVGNHTMNMVYADSPYNISLSYNNGISTKGKYHGSKTNDAKSDTEYKTFLKQAITNAVAVSQPDCHYFYYCDENYIWLLQQLYQEVEIHPQRVCLWIKNNANMVPQIAFNKVYEPVIYGTRGKPYLSPTITNFNEVLNKEVGTGNRLTDDILDLFSIWLEKRKAGQDYLHPTEKPVTLHEKPLRRCTRPGDLVLDTFGGSGSTLIACEQMRRRAFLLELDPIFCDVIIQRFTALTGKEAIYVS